MKILEFFAGLPTKVWGIICVAAGAALFLVTFYFNAKNKGATEATAKAAVKEAGAAEERAKVVTKSVSEDIRVVNDIKKEIDALPPSDITERASKWVRGPKPGTSDQD